MKKLLLLGFILSTTFANAQLLQEENFNALAIGNVGTAFDGITSGQNGFFTLASPNEGTTTNAGNSNFKITSSASARENIFTLEGANGNFGNRFMWKTGLDTQWNKRTAGNDLLVVAVEIQTAARGASENSFGVSVYDEDGRALTGFTVDSNTGELLLVSFSGTSGNENNYIYSLGSDADAGLYLPENAWSTIIIGYDYSTGESLIGYDDNLLGFTGNSGSRVPFEVNFTASSSTSSDANASATMMSFDNLSVEAVSNKLGIKKNILALGLKVYPNPTTEFLNVSLNNNSINAISIADLNGRIVKSKDYNSLSNITVNVSDLAAGVYMMNITSNNETYTKKIIKN